MEPKEKVLAEARREKEKGLSGIGGTGISWAEASVVEGKVEDELNLAEEELS